MSKTIGEQIQEELGKREMSGDEIPDALPNVHPANITSSLRGLEERGVIEYSAKADKWRLVTQAQEKFKIKTEFRDGGTVCPLDALELNSSNDPLLAQWSKKGIPIVARYIRAANAEIERLQVELAKPADGWTPITSKEQVQGLAEGFYLFTVKNDISYTVFKAIGVKNKPNSWKTIFDNGHFYIYADCDVNRLFEEFKLIQAFEKPEKRYQFSKASWTANEIASEPNRISCSEVTRELATDLVAEQKKTAMLEARIQELEGKCKN